MMENQFVDSEEVVVIEAMHLAGHQFTVGERLTVLRGKIDGDGDIWVKTEDDGDRYIAADKVRRTITIAVRPQTKSLDDITTLEVGDELRREGQPNILIMAILGSLVATSTYGHEDYPSWTTLDSLKRNGWQLKQGADQPTRLTKAQIEEKLGHRVEIVEEA